MRTCPKCGREYTAPPALSRVDNKTNICPICGAQEALEAAPLSDKQKADVLAAIEENEKGHNRI